MTNRPFLKMKIDFFENYVHDNYYSLDNLERLKIELQFRNTKTFPRYHAVNDRVEQRLTDLKEIHNWLKVNFKNETFKNWFFSEGERKNIFNKSVTTGATPVLEEDFDFFLNKHGISPYYMGTDLETLIVGQTNWNSEELLNQLYIRDGKAMKIYSQEMVIAFLGCGKDPFDNIEILQYFSHDHSALEFLMNKGFSWPSTVAIRGSGTLPKIGWHKQGLLSYMGYTVGEKAKPAKKRQEILDEVFKMVELPKVNSQQYLEEWSTAESGKRLSKMAHSIACFARNAKRKDPDSYALSIENWEDDLTWLENKFYKDRYKFNWPSTNVGNEYRKES